MSRSSTVVVNHCSGRPRFCSPYRNIIRGTHTSASIVIHASRMRRCGNASTASGTSHSENCGLHTLFVNRNSRDDEECHLRQPRPLLGGQRDVSDSGTTQYEQHQRPRR